MIDIAELSRQLDMIKSKVDLLYSKEVLAKYCDDERNDNLYAHFEKVSKNIYDDDKTYENIIIPKRSTKGSAGYDFISPVDIYLKPHESIVIKTGIRCKMDEKLVLLIMPRSGLGFKYKLQLANTVGVIDSDYYNSDNEGHIMIKIVNDNDENKSVNISKGSAFAQGIFVRYYTTDDDNINAERNGGFGSTDVNIDEKVNDNKNDSTDKELNSFDRVEKFI